MIDSVENELLPSWRGWDQASDPIDPELVKIMIDWAWKDAGFQNDVREGYRLDERVDIDPYREKFGELVRMWLSGATYAGIAECLGMSVDDMLGVHARVLTFAFQTLAEQGIALVGKLLEAQGRALAGSVAQFSEHLRFGVPTSMSLAFAAGGVKHRRAAIELGRKLKLADFFLGSRDLLFRAAVAELTSAKDAWILHLGRLMYDNTMDDLGWRSDIA